MKLSFSKFRPGPIAALLLLLWGCMPELPPAPELTAAFAELPGSLRLEFTTEQGRQVAYYLAPPTNPARPPAQLAVLYPGIGSVALAWLGFIDPAEAPDTGWLMIDYPGRGEKWIPPIFTRTARGRWPPWPCIAKGVKSAFGFCPVTPQAIFQAATKTPPLDFLCFPGGKFINFST